MNSNMQYLQIFKTKCVFKKTKMCKFASKASLQKTSLNIYLVQTVLLSLAVSLKRIVHEKQKGVEADVGLNSD